MRILCIFCIFLFCSSGHAQSKLYPHLFPLSDVTILSGPFKQARELNIETLLKYDVDRLLYPFMKEAGLPVTVKGYSNWDGLDGHVGGHYLSALAMNYAATGNAECGRRMEHMIATLKSCQEANGVKYPDWGIGYAGGVPKSNAVWSNLKKGEFDDYRAAWVPWYNLHKIYAGLRDAWSYTGNTGAKTIFLQFCDWGINITAGLSEDQMQRMLDIEHGGMNEIFADAYQMTGDTKYLTAAKRFSHRMLLDAMAAGKDNLDNKHANTQVPKAIGFQRIAELSQDEGYAKAARFFWETVTTRRSLAFGGNSRREHFPAISSCSDFIDDVEGPESCNTYNMLRLTEDLFSVNPSAAYADYYERAVYNHILSTQHPGHGGYVYFTPARPRHYRVYSAPNQAMWCCVGSGMENHGKYNQFIYAHYHDSLFLNLFIASELNWKEKGIMIRQETNFPYEEQTKLVVTKGSSRFKWMIRYPSWVKKGTLRITVNGKKISYTSHPSSYISIDRLWKKGDVIQVSLPMYNSIEYLPNMPDYIAFMHGPILLGAKTGTEDMTGLIADDGRWAHIAGGKRLPLDRAPIIIEDNITKAPEKLVPSSRMSLHFTIPGLKVVNATGTILLQPFYEIHDSRYMMYWMTLSNDKYRSYLDSLSKVEQYKLSLQQRTIDFVAPGEQQPEADHDLQKENSNTGNYLNEFWRDARSGGYFSYNLATKGETRLSLVVRYWGAEWGGRKFNIYIDDENLLTENNTGRWNQSKFHDVEYPIPESMVKDKKNIRVKFQPMPGNTAGAVYYIRVVKRED